MRAFADALDDIPTALADNSGLNPIEVVSKTKAKQIEENNSRLGIDCMGVGTSDMKEQKVYETYISKKQ